MSGRWKRKEEEYESDGSGDSHARPNKVSKADSDDIVVCEVTLFLSLHFGVFE